jgi:hypothetical protein
MHDAERQHIDYSHLRAAALPSRKLVHDDHTGGMSTLPTAVRGRNSVSGRGGEHHVRGWCRWVTSARRERCAGAGGRGPPHRRRRVEPGRRLIPVAGCSLAVS